MHCLYEPFSKMPNLRSRKNQNESSTRSIYPSIPLPPPERESPSSSNNLNTLPNVHHNNTTTDSHSTEPLTDIINLQHSETQTNIIPEQLLHNCDKKIRLPNFWCDNPEAWFMNADLQFALNNIIVDNTKYLMVLSALQQEIFCKVLDFIQSPPLFNLYDGLRKVLCNRFAISEDVRLQQLLNNTQLTDQKPSELYSEMKILCGSMAAVNNDLLFKLWLRRLPQHMQIHLVSSLTTSIDEKLSLADNIYAISNNNKLYSLNQTQSVENLVQDLTQHTTTLQEQIQNIAHEINAIKQQNFKVPSQHNTTNQNFCWYHFKFGINARKCIQPCNFNMDQRNKYNMNLN